MVIKDDSRFPGLLQAAEIPQFIALNGEQLYVVRHRPLGPVRARVLCCPPFGLERTLAYTSLVRFARLLAHRGFEAIRFDYRGTGESPGQFEAFGFSDWEQDARAVLLHFARARSPRILLFGLRFGALLASRLFAQGRGDALLAWDPPTDARSMLLDHLRRKLAASRLRDQADHPTPDRRAYVEHWLREGTLEVEGVRWGRALWHDSADFRFDLPQPRDTRSALALHLNRRGPAARLPVGHERLRIPQPPFWDHGPELLPDLSRLFQRSLDFLEATPLPTAQTSTRGAPLG